MPLYITSGNAGREAMFPTGLSTATREKSHQSGGRTASGKCARPNEAAPASCSDRGATAARRVCSTATLRAAGLVLWSEGGCQTASRRGVPLRSKAADSRRPGHSSAAHAWSSQHPGRITPVERARPASGALAGPVGQVAEPGLTDRSETAHLCRPQTPLRAGVALVRHRDKPHTRTAVFPHNRHTLPGPWTTGCTSKACAQCPRIRDTLPPAHHETGVRSRLTGARCGTLCVRRTCLLLLVCPSFSVPPQGKGREASEQLAHHGGRHLAVACRKTTSCVRPGERSQRLWPATAMCQGARRGHPSP